MEPEIPVVEHTPNAGGTVTFTPEQQTKVNEFINSAVGRAAAKERGDRARVEQELADARAKLDELEKVRAQSSSAPGKEALEGKITEYEHQLGNFKTENQKLREIAAQNAIAAEKAREAELNTRKRVAISEAAQKSNFYNVSMIAKMTEQEIQYDKELGKFVAINEHGQPRLRPDMTTPLSLEEYYSEFASQNKFLVKGDMPTGMGSTTNSNPLDSTGTLKWQDVFGKNSQPVLTIKLLKERPADYARLRAQAVQAGAIAP